MAALRGELQEMRKTVAQFVSQEERNAESQKRREKLKLRATQRMTESANVSMALQYLPKDSPQYTKFLLRLVELADQSAERDDEADSPEPNATVPPSQEN